MEATAFVSCRDVGQMVSSLDRESLNISMAYLLWIPVLVRLKSLPLGEPSSTQRKPSIRMPSGPSIGAERNAEQQGTVANRLAILRVDEFHSSTRLHDQLAVPWG